MGPKSNKCTFQDGTMESVGLGAVFQSVFLNHVKYFNLRCIECLLLWFIVDIFLLLTLCHCSPHALILFIFYLHTTLV